jgi:NhaP-type Na+/H+ or K+/H+ antiporter
VHLANAQQSELAPTSPTSLIRGAMNLLALICIGIAIIAYGLFSKRLRATPITAPLAFSAFGFLCGAGALSLARIDLAHGAVEVLAEVTLVIVLFSDAARIDARRLFRDHDLPARMLLVGLPLTILAGGAVAYGLFPSLGVAGALLLASTLAPTDAALGQPVVTDRAVPVRVRQALNVESGLNDGIALPAVLICLSIASAGAAAGESVGDFVKLGVLQVTLGPAAGILVGAIGGRLVARAARAGLSSRTFEGMSVLAMALLAFAVAELVGGNGFIAAFTAGLAFGAAARERCSVLVEFMETEGQLLTLLTFFIFGAALLPEAIPHLDGRVILYAALSLTVIRMVPVALSMVDSGVSRPTTFFLGWFGPRGLASILFALLILAEAELPYRDEVLVITLVTVALSVVLHGVTAAPLARAYGDLVGRMGECEETEPVVEMPLRHGNVRSDDPESRSAT